MNNNSGYTKAILFFEELKFDLQVGSKTALAVVKSQTKVI